MRRIWNVSELEQCWTLSTAEREMTLTNATAANRLGFAALLKWFEQEGRFPQNRADLPPAAVSSLARQLDLPAEALESYEWRGRSIERHRAQIRHWLGFREFSDADEADLSEWIIISYPILGARPVEAVRSALYQRLREARIEPPGPSRIERLVRSGLRRAEEHFAASVAAQLSAESRMCLDQLLETQIEVLSEEDETIAVHRSALQDLRASSMGALQLSTLLAEIERLERIRWIGLPDSLFAQTPLALLESCRRRIATEELHEVRRHPEALRHTLLAAFCRLRAEEITDNLADLVCDIVHRIGAKAEKRVEKALLRDLKKVYGKDRILFRIAQASLEKPDGRIREVIFPVVPEQTLRDVAQEYLAGGSYERRVHVVMRASYTHHYRRMLPPLLKTLRFGSSNARLLQAISLLKRYAESDAHRYAPDEIVRWTASSRRTGTNWW